MDIARGDEVCISYLSEELSGVLRRHAVVGESPV